MDEHTLSIQIEHLAYTSEKWMSNESIMVDSFMAHHDAPNAHSNLERIMDILMELNRMKGASSSSKLQLMSELTELTAATIKTYKDPTFGRVVKAFGWTGLRYLSDDDHPFDCEEFLHALSNLYLKGQSKLQQQHWFADTFAEFDSMIYLEKITAFCPDIVIQYLRNNPDLCRGSELSASSFKVVGACMLIDISNFSKYSASMCSMGLKGLDELHKTTSGLLGEFVKSVYEHDGDVVAFAGDALICLFPFKSNAATKTSDANDFSPSFSEQLSSVDPCFRALHCANQLRTVKYQELSTHIGISFGEMYLSLLGGYNGQWIYMLNGEPLAQLARCIDDAKAQSVVLTEHCHAQLLLATSAPTPPPSFEPLSNPSTVSQPSADAAMIPPSTNSSPIEYPEMKFEPLPSGNYLLEQMTHCHSMVSLLNDVGRMESLSRSPTKDSRTLSKAISSRRFSFNSHSSSVSPVLPDQGGRNGEYEEKDSRESRKGSHPSPTKVAFRMDPSPMREGHSSPFKVMRLTTKKSSRNLLMEKASVDNLFSANPRSEDPNTNGSSSVDTNRLLIDALALFLPLPVTLALHTEGNHQISELRQVTTLFLSLDSYSPVQHADPLTLQAAFVTAQQVLSETGGFLRQFLIDDKGCVLIAMWGVPSYSYANNCSRALCCAATLKKRLEELGHSCSMGITTGTVFCGTIGASERSDYAGIGTEVNLAARFMAKAKGRILIDKNTFNNLSTSNRQLLLEGEATVLKGMPMPIVPYELPADALPVQSSIDVTSSISSQQRSKLLRKKVMQLLEKELDKVACRGVSIHSPQHYRQTLIRAPRTKSHRLRGLINNNVHCIIMCGPPGSGKTTAAEYFRIAARERGIQTIHIKLQAMHRSMPYQLIRDLFLELVGPQNFATRDQQHEFLRDMIDEIHGEKGAADVKMAARLSIEMVLGLQHVCSEPGSLSSSQIIPPTEGGFDSPMHGTGTNSSVSSPGHRIQMIDAKGEEFGPSSQTTQDLFFSSLGDRSQPFPKLESGRNRTDTAFYHVLQHLLRSIPTALTIEDAHYCDELSWNELLLLIMGGDIDLSILLMIKSSPQHRLKSLSTGRMEGNGGSHMCTNPRFSTSSNDRDRTCRPDSSSSFLDDMPNDVLSSMSLDHIPFASFQAIAEHPNTRFAEMKGLNEEEVRSLLVHTLNAETVSSNLVDLVMSVSNGNPYWCKVMAKYVLEFGLQHLEETMALDAQYSHQRSLKTLILCRYEQLSAPHQKVLKHAAVLGLEFDVEILAACTPLPTSMHAMKNKLPATQVPLTIVVDVLEQLEKNGFVHCIQEEPRLLYSFQNDLIQRAIYELLPPSDAEHLHISCAEHIEAKHRHSLRPFYPMLAHHYERGNQRSKAFKYEIKSAALAVSCGAFNDGLMFATSALDLADNIVDLDILTELICQAVTYLQLHESPEAKKNFLQSFYQISGVHVDATPRPTPGRLPDEISAFSPTADRHRSSSLLGDNLDSILQLSQKDSSLQFVESYFANDQHSEAVTAQSFRQLRERAEVMRNQMALGQQALTEPEEISLRMAKAELMRSNTLNVLPARTAKFRTHMSESTTVEHGNSTACCTLS